MTIENRLDDEILKEHFDNIKSQLNESSKLGVWDLMENYISENPEFMKLLDERNVSVIQAGDYFLGYSLPKTGLLEHAARIEHPQMFRKSNLRDPYNNS